ncbi:LysR family transcriptional regulator [Microvirga aerophila]|uniref:LysR family transcriptional regulator n=1 Tax=Microvirga aerophila TaxID=670291 RepID=A0A512C1Q8_9HYPH|nr:LysR family transcriptional regulator [Microvirga aerophila]GEO18144.1 LysR family transcriptional regulator [Microvirga aerophila]
MSKIDHLDLDGHLLTMFLAVLEEGSVTAAATRLGVTQSAVSHGLEKLRRVARDPLFVKSGRGIVATAHARALADRARRLIDDMKEFAASAAFDPLSAQVTFTVAANDFQRDLLLPQLFQKMEAIARHVTLRVIPSGLPTPDLLREGRCDLLISPLPPEGMDILQKHLLQDKYVCYYDPRMRVAPQTQEDYLAGRHITVVYTDNERLNFDKRLARQGVARNIAVSVPAFSAVPAFLEGSELLASMPNLLSQGLMRTFASISLPLKTVGTDGFVALPMYMAWHRRFQQDPAHQWLRNLLEETASMVTARQRTEI